LVPIESTKKTELLKSNDPKATIDVNQTPMLREATNAKTSATTERINSKS
jgi:hypothetical protein